LIVNLSGKQAGFLVDQVADIVQVETAEIQPAPDIDIGEPDVISGLVRVGSRDGSAADDAAMVLLLEMDALGITRQLEMAAA
ncbi:MAG: hypothetical protein RIS17_1852, partial [Pseudomonadota bacterium]